MEMELQQKIDRWVEAHHDEILADLRALVEIPSVSIPEGADGYPFGPDCAKVLDAALRMAEERGMSAKNYDNYYGLAESGDGGNHIGIFAHLDVVEVGEGWTFPPFEMTEKDGWLFGRGVADDKIAAVIGMYTAMAIRELGLAPDCRLTLYLGCCEEKGMSDIDRYVSEHEQPEFNLVPDFKFPVSTGEGGVLKFTMDSRERLQAVKNLRGGAPAERLPLHAASDYPALSTEGKAPEFGKPGSGVNALKSLCEQLLEAPEAAPDRELLELLLSLNRAQDGEVFGIAGADEDSGSLTCTCRCVETKEDGSLHLQFDCRFPVCFTGDELVEKIKSWVDAHGWTMEVSMNSAPFMIPKEDPRIRLLCDAWGEVVGKEDVKPMFGGGTYARKLKNAVGYGPHDNNRCPFLPKGHGEIHSPDETRSVECVMNAVRTYIRAVDALDRHLTAEKKKGGRRA